MCAHCRVGKCTAGLAEDQNEVPCLFTSAYRIRNGIRHAPFYSASMVETDAHICLLSYFSNTYFQAAAICNCLTKVSLSWKDNVISARRDNEDDRIERERKESMPFH